MKGVTRAFSSDRARTARRSADIDAYFGSQVLDADTFICRSAEACRASHTGAFYEAQAHHVGRHFDLSTDGRPMRIVVTGQEYGGPPSNVNRNMRSEMVAGASGCRQRFFRSGAFPARNPHMRGTTSLLRVFLGRGLGSDHEGEFVQVDGRPVHVFECFALVNFLICSAVAGDARAWDPATSRSGRPGRSTATMQRNCATHYRRALEILEPTVVVAQGKGVRRWMRRVVDRAERTHPFLPIERVTIGAVECHLLTFAHPASPSAENWGMNDRQPYLLKTVTPTIDELFSSSEQAVGPLDRVRKRP